VDDVEPAVLINPLFKVELDLSTADNVVIEAYSHPIKGYIIHSSTNPASYFSDEKLIERLFIGSTKLLHPVSDN
jgi:hypothetical protein